MPSASGDTEHREVGALCEDDDVVVRPGVELAIDAIDELPKSRTLWFRNGGGQNPAAMTKRRTSIVEVVVAAGRAAPDLDEPASSRPGAARRDVIAPSPFPPLPSLGELEHVERLSSFVNEGHLYRYGTRHFLVFTGASGHGRDVCETERDRHGHWSFAAPLVRAASRAAAIEKLRARLDVLATSDE